MYIALTLLFADSPWSTLYILTFAWVMKQKLSICFVFVFNNLVTWTSFQFGPDICYYSQGKQQSFRSHKDMQSQLYDSFFSQTPQQLLFCFLSAFLERKGRISSILSTSLSPHFPLSILFSKRNKRIEGLLTSSAAVLFFKQLFLYSEECECWGSSWELSIHEDEKKSGMILQHFCI